MQSDDETAKKSDVAVLTCGTVPMQRITLAEPNSGTLKSKHGYRDRRGKRYQARFPPLGCIAAAAVLFSSNAHAQGEGETSDFDSLTKRLEALAKIVEAQAEKIDQQQTEIEALKASREDPQAAPLDGERASAEIVIADDATHQEAETQTEQTDDTASDDRIGRFPDTAIVRPGDFDRSITIPGDTGSFRIGGFVRAQINYDFDSIGIQDSAIPFSIPLDGSPEDGTEQIGFGVRDSQLNFDYRRETSLGLLRTFIEFDFFGDGDELNADFGVRLRHAALGIGKLQFGQFWSLFTDLNATPEVADLLGPHGAPILRTPGLRWSDKIGDKWTWAIGIENPAGDITAEASDLASESVPNIVGRIERTGGWGHVRVSGVGKELRSTTDKVFVGGVNLTGRINLPFVTERDNLVFGGQVGSGFTQQYAPFGGVGLDGVVDENGQIDATEILSGYVGYQHWWTDLLRSTVYVSAHDFDPGVAFAPDTFEGSFKTAGNLFWSPVSKATVGAEILYITRDTLGGEQGDGIRMQAIAQFNF